MKNIFVAQNKISNNNSAASASPYPEGIRRLCVRSFPIICALLILPFSLFANDFGIILDQTAGYGGTGSEGSFDYNGAVIPRASFFLGDSGELYFSASAKVEYYEESDTLDFVPELLRTELSLRVGDFGLRAGRMQYTDPLGFIVNGLFDGAQFFIDTSLGIFSAGAWYTGLLYKKRADIYMTPEELESYNEALDFGKFTDTYFAPRRMIAAIGWEHPALAEFVRIRAAALGQFDLSGGELHTQYLAAKVTVPVGSFIFDFGGSLGLALNENTNISLAGELAAAYMLPTSFDSRLSLMGRFSSGVIEDTNIRTFLPVTTVSQGDVLGAKLSGLSMITLEYLARLHRTVSLGLSSSCFVRSDLAYTEYPVNADSSGYFLGTEIFGRIFWNPVSDMQFNLGGGAFLPSLGNVSPDADALWRVELNFILSIY